VTSRDGGDLATALVAVCAQRRVPENYSFWRHRSTRRTARETIWIGSTRWQPWIRSLRRSLAILVVLILVTAWFSELFYFPDEHYQVLEFMSYRLGRHHCGRNALGIFRPRSSLVPAAAVFPDRQTLILFGGERHVRDRVLSYGWPRGCFRLRRWRFSPAQCCRPIEGEEEKRAFVRYLPLFGSCPICLCGPRPKHCQRRSSPSVWRWRMERRTAARLAGAGLICGLAFECRYQVAFMGLGLFAWLAVIARARLAGLAAFLGGGLCSMLLGVRG